MADLRRISNSEIKAFKRCRRRWWLGYYRSLQPKREEWTGARALGNKLHTVLGDYYDPSKPDIDSPETALGLWDRMLQEDLERSEDEAHAAITKEADLGRAMLEGYFDWLAEEGADSDIEVIGAEREVEVEMTGYDGPRPVALIAKLDVAVRRRSNGSRFFIDHKSVQSLGDLPGLADIDEQFLMYSLLDYLEHAARGETSEDSFVDGGMFNMLRKVKRTKTAKPPFFGRHEVRHSVDELRSFWLRLAGEIADVQLLEDRLAEGADHRMVAYPSPTRDCSWDCVFRAVCPMLDDPKSDAEGFIQDVYEIGDPYARYTEVGRETE